MDCDAMEDVIFSLTYQQKILLPLQTLCAEIEIHEAHKDSICKRGQELVDSQHPEADQVAERTQDLQGKYDNLKKLADDYKAQLDLSLQAKQVRLVFQSHAF